MKALTYHGALDVRVDNVADPVLQKDDDILLKVTATAICGSDLHMYRGKIPAMKSGDILGHEFMGEVVDTGKGVTALSKGDRVVVPFVIACGLVRLQPSLWRGAGWSGRVCAGAQSQCGPHQDSQKFVG